MLRYKADRRSWAFIFVYFTLLATGFVLRPEAWWARIALIVATAQFSFFCAVIVHNTIHVPMFRKRIWNKLTQVVLTLTYGHPVSMFVPGHNLSHHMHTQTPRDIMRTTKLRFRWNLLNQLFFMHAVSGAVTKANFQYAAQMRKEKPAWFRQFLIEAGVFLSVMGALLLLDWQCFIMYVLIPHQFAAWGIVGINFVQHDGCDPSHPANHSRNFVGKWINWWAFNNGFHGIHHVTPGLHWSRAPEEHARVLGPHIHPALEQPSLIAYCFKAFIWPGKRLTYDGKPVVLPPKEPDQPWIPGLADLSPEVSLGAEAH